MRGGAAAGAAAEGLSGWFALASTRTSTLLRQHGQHGGARAWVAALERPPGGSGAEAPRGAEASPARRRGGVERRSRRSRPQGGTDASHEAEEGSAWWEEGWTAP
eukprot:2090112-Prymnesium_polylepis.1